MKRWFRSRQIYRVFYLFGFVMLLSGMLLSMATGPVQAGFVDDTAAKKKQPQGPIALQETVIPPTDVPPTDVPPTEVPPTEVPPTEVPPTEVPPTEVPPTEEPTEAPPTEEPTEIVPTDVTPTEAPTEEPTQEPTDVPVLRGDVGFLEGDTAVCMIGGGELSAEVGISLEGGDSAILQMAWRVAEPADLRTPTYYSYTDVSDGDVVSISGSWPGIRPTDSVVEIHLGAILLDPVTRNPISGGDGFDFYWYPWVCPVGAPVTLVPTDVLPTEVLPTEVLPTEVLPTDVTPTEVLPTEVLPTDVTPTDVLPTMEVTEMPTEVPTEMPTEVLPTDVTPTDMVTETPTEMPTALPTDVVPGTPEVGFVESDTAVCIMAPGVVSASVQVSLPAGLDSAVLQTAWKVAEPVDLRTSEVYSYQNVSNGDTVAIEGQWPGIREGDQVVEVHLGAILLDPDTMAPISDGVGLDYYWYPWFCPVGAPATLVPTDVLPTEVLPTDVVPTEVLPTEILPTEVLPTEVLPTEILPTEVLPTEVTPTDVAPTVEVTDMPTDVPTEFPTDVPTLAPTDVVPGTPDIGFVEGDTAVCLLNSATVSASVQVSLPAGMDSAVLQTAWKVAEPADLRTSEVYSYQNVSNGDTVLVEGQWPGVRAGDQVVEVHLGAILLDPETMNPISDGVGIDYFWYPWVCPIGAPVTEVPPTEIVPTDVVPTDVVPTEVLPTEVVTEVPTEMPTEMPTEVPTVVPGVPSVGFEEGSQVVCPVETGPITATVIVDLPAGVDSAVLQTAWRVVEPADLRTGEMYEYHDVMDGDSVTITAQWPGVREGDEMVEVHFGAILLDPGTMNPISDGAGIDYYWYPWSCPVGSPTAAPTQIVPDVVTPPAVSWWHAFWYRLMSLFG